MNLSFLICEMGTILPHGIVIRIREIMNVKHLVQSLTGSQQSIGLVAIFMH